MHGGFSGWGFLRAEDGDMYVLGELYGSLGLKKRTTRAMGGGRKSNGARAGAESREKARAAI